MGHCGSLDRGEPPTLKGGPETNAGIFIMTEAASKPRVLVVGGGIGGLSTALALSRKGIPVQVLEQAQEFKEIGAGIQLGPNVFRMFEVLGLTEQIFHWAAFPEGLELRDSITAETIVDTKIDKH